ncbi:MAG: response regulator, partial [Chrysiogenales bacterium]
MRGHEVEARGKIFGRPRILCADDDLESLEVIGGILERRGYEPVCVSNGHDALDVIKRNDIELALLDVMMHDMDGYELCRRIKNGNRKAIPVIMVTGLRSKEDRVRSIEAGAEDFISKPLDATEVLARIRMLLSIKSLNDEREMEMDFARKIQHSLLPWDMPVIRGGRAAFTYVPLSDIGGDFVDILYLPDTGEVGLFICDVSGHGVSSAMIASMVKMSLSSWREHLASPAGLLEHIRRSLIDKIGDNYITACVCHLDLGSGRMRAACAGHPPVFIAGKAGDIGEVRGRGNIIYGHIAPGWEEVETILAPGDRIVLYTDGVFEARKGRELFGLDRLAGLIGSGRAKTPGEL